MKTQIKKTPRYLAVELLTRISKNGTYSNLGLNQVIKQNALSSRDAHFLTNLVYGELQHRLTLEYWLKPFIKHPQRVAPWVKELLLLSLYQLKYLDDIPDFAVLNEAIEIAKVKGHAGIRRFVTGVLRNVQRQGLRSFSGIKPVEKKLSIEFSIPLWLIKELISETGLAKTEKILAAVNQPAKMSVRNNLALSERSDVISDLAKEKIKAVPSKVAARGIVVEDGFVPDSRAYAEGKVSIQDESAMLAVESMNVMPDDKVLDACAAPGGKTTQIALNLGEEGKVAALDIHKHKVYLIAKNAVRLGLKDKVEPVQLDARKAPEHFAKESFSKILVDAPCSGLGLIRRKPEIRYDKKLDDSKHLHNIQLSILEAAASVLKQGGQLTYSTCTILKQENQAVIDEFLKRNPDFKQVKTITKNKIKDDRKELALTIYPDDFLSDGFFIASLIKTGGE